MRTERKKWVQEVFRWQRTGAWMKAGGAEGEMGNLIYPISSPTQVAAQIRNSLLRFRLAFLLGKDSTPT